MTATAASAFPESGLQDRVNEYFRSCADFWSDIYGADGVEATIYRERKEAVLRLAGNLRLPADSRILEVGCGAGLVTVELARRGYYVQAVDSVPAMVHRTQQLAREAGVEGRVESRVGDVHALNFPDESFDLVLAIGVLPWVGAMGGPLLEMARVTRTLGHLILTVDNAWRLNHILDPRCFPALRVLRRKVRAELERLGALAPDGSSPRHTLCSVRQFDAAISSSGLSKSAGFTLGFGPFTFMGLALFSETNSIRAHRLLQRRADRGKLLTRYTGVEYIVLAQKPTLFG